MSKGDILIVDDNLNNLQLLGNLLTENEYRVRMANSGRRAIGAIRAGIPELIMLDITMPEMDGYEVCQQLKADPTTNPIPIIFISALDDVFDKVKAFKVGGVDYITKPFQIEEVLVRIENQLTISRLRKELERQNIELAKEKEALLLAQKRTNLVFSALAETLPGTVLEGKYRLEHKIGKGGYAVVYKATQLSLNRPVAIKIFQPTPGNDSGLALDRFRFEGASTSRITHPNAVSILEFDISFSGIAYLAMEFLQGYTLADELGEKKIFSSRRSLEIIIPVCEVLAEAHKLGIIHRDIKPDNIFLHQTSNGEVVKVLDFGIAKSFNNDSEIYVENLTSEGLVLGTPTYMSPERLKNHPYDGRSDVYSVGIILYHMLSGECPFEAFDRSVTTIITMHLMHTPAPIQEMNPNVPGVLAEIVMKTLDKRAENRPTAQNLVEQLSQILPTLPIDPIDNLRTERTVTPNQTRTIHNTITTQIMGED